MKKLSFIFVGFVLMTALNGCAGYRTYQFNRGAEAGERACKYGREAKKEGWDRGFYVGFLMENFKGSEKE